MPLDEADRCRTILEAAKGQFIQQGFARTRMEDIAKAAGLSRPLLYRHFKNKEAVLIELARRVTEQSLARAQAALRGTASCGTGWKPRFSHGRKSTSA